jgi:LysB family phage lysis regulatory protein
MELITKILISALLVGTLGVIIYVQRDGLNAAKLEISGAKQAIKDRDDIISTLKAAAVANKKSLAKLEADRQGIASTLSERENLIESLQHENATIRNWADTALPDAIASLRERPAITGAGGYRQRLPASDALQPAGGGAKD